jgi:hypothetical protein
MGFSAAMADRGYRKKQSNTIHWLDVATLKDVQDFIDQDGNVLDFPDGSSSSPSSPPVYPEDDWPL